MEFRSIVERGVALAPPRRHLLPRRDGKRRALDRYFHGHHRPQARGGSVAPKRRAVRARRRGLRRRDLGRRRRDRHMFLSARAQRIYGLEPGVMVRPRTQWWARVVLHPKTCTATARGRGPPRRNAGRLRRRMARARRRRRVPLGADPRPVRARCGWAGTGSPARSATSTSRSAPRRRSGCPRSATPSRCRRRVQVTGTEDRDRRVPRLAADARASRHCAGRHVGKPHRVPRAVSVPPRGPAEVRGGRRCAFCRQGRPVRYRGSLGPGRRRSMDPYARHLQSAIRLEHPYAGLVR